MSAPAATNRVPRSSPSSGDERDPTTTPSPTTSRQQTLHHSLLFTLGESSFRVELARLREVVPWATLDPAEERGLLGWLNLRGDRIPIVDLGEIILGTPTERHLGSRILILDCISRNRPRTVGALAAEVFSMARDDEAEFAERFDPCDVLSSVLAGLA